MTLTMLENDVVGSVFLTQFSNKTTQPRNQVLGLARRSGFTFFKYAVKN
jgi:hypothetical protein